MSIRTSYVLNVDITIPSSACDKSRVLVAIEIQDRSKKALLLQLHLLQLRQRRISVHRQLSFGKPRRVDGP